MRAPEGRSQMERRCRGGMTGSVKRGAYAMKKTVLSIIAVALLLTLVCASALASTGDITIKAAKAYSDSGLTNYIGTIPKYTCLQVRAYGSYADVTVNGVRCYVDPATLTRGEKNNDYMGTATLQKGALIYQRPTYTARYTTAKKAAKVYVYAVKKGMALIRSKKGSFGFVSLSSLNLLKSGN